MVQGERVPEEKGGMEEGREGESGSHLAFRAPERFLSSCSKSVPALGRQEKNVAKHPGRAHKSKKTHMRAKTNTHLVIPGFLLHQHFPLGICCTQLIPHCINLVG